MGGSTFDSRDTTLEDLVALRNEGKNIVVVHGGGNVVTEWLTRQDVATRFVRGERVTDADTLEVVVAVLAGLANKEITAGINCLGGRAVGISGVDGALVQGRIKDAEMGYTGAVVDINPALLEMLLSGGFIPVVSPVSLHAFDRSEGSSHMLNINGDLVTGEIAAALGAEKLIFLTDVAGVCDKSGEVIERLSVAEAESLIDSGVASGGMIPKISACLRALTGGGKARIINGKQPHALVQEMKDQIGGTTIYN